MSVWIATQMSLTRRSKRKKPNKAVREVADFLKASYKPDLNNQCLR